MRGLAAATGSLETMYRVQKGAGEGTVGGVQRAEGIKSVLGSGLMVVCSGGEGSEVSWGVGCW